MVRFLLYSNEFDVEGIAATTSTWLRNKVNPEMIMPRLDAYEQVLPNLRQHASGYPFAEALRQTLKHRRFFISFYRRKMREHRTCSPIVGRLSPWCPGDVV
ncbi:nucleoside hydrolase-like domain-containing protein [Pectobacterium sp. A5351]|uniref:nucleoside hydrolase-like domain-containing protein n=1 Tax=Pectobacterium sp. A5351 TaxID=2914983 RepID=UPI0023313620|nr:nucleoside hydrolase-like domain-containing protein [Pectobacterium sp. A5351]WCG82782.1 DUF1593 domain-containing protein [Pectobacterium sp. A5351]